MSTGCKISRFGPIPKATLRSLRDAYALANRQAAALTRVYKNNPLALIDLQGEIERGADKANSIAQRAQTRASARTAKIPMPWIDAEEGDMS